MHGSASAISFEFKL